VGRKHINYPESNYPKKDKEILRLKKENERLEKEIIKMAKFLKQTRKAFDESIREIARLKKHKPIEQVLFDEIEKMNDRD
jgi:hypothetical protein